MSAYNYVISDEQYLDSQEYQTLLLGNPNSNLDRLTTDGRSRPTITTGPVASSLSEGFSKHS